MQKKKHILLLLAGLALVLAVSSVAYRRLSEEYGAPDLLPEVKPEETEAEISVPEQEEGETDIVPAPDFTVYDPEGKAVRLSDFLGQTVVLNFWASWCPPCQQEMPDFNEVYGELGDEIVFMMVDLVDGSRETMEKGAAYVEAQGFDFPVYYDLEQEAAWAYLVQSIPSTYFIDVNGNVTVGARGAINGETLLRGISMALEADREALPSNTDEQE